MDEYTQHLSQTRKKRTALWLGVLIAVFLIAISIVNLELAPGIEIDFEPHEQTQLNLTPAQQLDFGNFSFLTGALAFILAAAALAFIGRLLIMLKWKSILVGIFVITLSIIALNIPNPIFGSNQSQNADVLPQILQQPQSGPVILPESLAENQYLLWIMIPLLLAAVFIWKRLEKPEKKTNGLEEIFLDALEQASNRSESSEVSVHSLYRKLLKYIEEENEIIKPAYMTASEFVQVLIELGLPEEPVREMSSLFEKARYGKVPLNNEENQAVKACVLNIYKSIRQNEER